ncbi:MAG: hypothetical protein Q8N31_12015 [Reyranella sp.]|nr:hypothetical protein [Reyranella sp.]MDP3160737.1 hypothetical protein [Reyranella sp.]
MFIRRTFDEFLKLHSAAELLAGARDWVPRDWVPRDWVPRDWVIDWRWLSPAPDEEASESERALIEWPAWARPKTPSRE